MDVMNKALRTDTLADLFHRTILRPHRKQNEHLEYLKVRSKWHAVGYGFATLSKEELDIRRNTEGFWRQENPTISNK